MGLQGASSLSLVQGREGWRYQRRQLQECMACRQAVDKPLRSPVDDASRSVEMRVESTAATGPARGWRIAQQATIVDTETCHLTLAEWDHAFVRRSADAP